MSISDLIAVLALAISLVSLFVSFTTKFTDFAKASWVNIFWFVMGISYGLLGLVGTLLLAILIAYLNAEEPPILAPTIVSLIPQGVSGTIILLLSPIFLIFGIALLIVSLWRERNEKR